MIEVIVILLFIHCICKMDIPEYDGVIKNE